ncbi:LysR family transcriptional regulator [Klebsiella aerogenes]|jgi:DNA-binding transcriptional LysR family regulator|uniref:LysR family transcriptional regulator n=1 Tax=Klebsiella aerogenes TaxID=548 RepID=UPI00050084A3|nr:LysR family transcriptional regulator [Klebsiella aerogenes]EKV7119335.1 LysR family transcriptional regulator [Klebsiella aerogenes]EKZ9890008.1 LysR family transcriptional regulator [Klebsiella aerogenes]ELA2348250.1 LysR family transcriptional regulator [Klebsiella aerogenes]KGB07507.1 bacterial regulatory helix-turn-helix, lysR family protein [Klebsiella aerogenes]KLE79437.1 LysR family transcriptional regulator [Klebsiella aerogenes]
MKADFNWDDTRIFLAVARSGTLSGAAETMDMGIATLSRRLDRLEKSLAVPLFSRHQSGYRLTDDGEALLARAEALEHAGLAFGETARLQGNVAGLVRLATSDNLAAHFILPSLNGLMEKYPDLRVEVLSGVQSVNLHRRDADLAIRMVKPESGNLTLKRLGKVGFGLYSADTGLAGSTDVAFNHAQYIGWPESHQHLPAARWITRTLRGRPCRVEANTLLAQLSAVSAGLGLGVLPHFMARKNGLHCVNADIGVDQTLWLVMHSDLAHSRRVRVVADHLIALFDEIKDQLTSP